MKRHALDDGSELLEGRLPPRLLAETRASFESLWALHPGEFHEVVVAGRPIRTPRWQQAYGADYRYTGRVNRAIPVPRELEPLADWARATVDARLGPLLVNWYDAALEHHISRHRDRAEDMIPGSPIVTISLGAPRTFRLRPWRREGSPRDFVPEHGTVFVMPWDTNLAWTHEVPHFARDDGRRISVTLRAFRNAAPK